MTIFAVICGHLPASTSALAAFCVPYPNQLALWPNFRSPLLWDVFAVNTYFTVSLMFWFLGMVPDIASMRDRAKNPWVKFIYTLLSVGWRGSAEHWQHYEKAYLLLAGLATGLVLSVHSVVSFDFAVSVVPGWHMTIFPPYFVTGAIFAGFAMVMMVLIVVRETMDLKHLITDYHLEVMNKVILGTSCLMGYAYIMEGFTAWYSQNEYLHHAFKQYLFGAYGWAGWTVLTCNVLIPQLFWFERLRRSYWSMIFVGVAVTIGMWFERFVIIVMSLSGHLPSAWRLYVPPHRLRHPPGSFGIFFSLVLLFARVLPVIATTEVKAILPGSQPAHGGGDHDRA